MNVEKKGNNLVITIPMNSPLVPSKSGKSLVVASSNGNVTTNLDIEGKKLVVGLNCYVSAK